MYLDDVIVFDSDPSARVKTMHALFERLCKDHLKLSPPKARLAAAGADFLGHSVSPAPKRRENIGFDCRAHAPPTQAASFSAEQPFVPRKASARYVEADSTKHRPPQARRQILVHAGHGSHCCVTCWQTSPLHRSWSSPIGSPWTTTPARSRCTATPASMALALHLSRSSSTAP